jgi:hypothetical protein
MGRIPWETNNKRVQPNSGTHYKMEVASNGKEKAVEYGRDWTIISSTCIKRNRC